MRLKKDGNLIEVTVKINNKKLKFYTKTDEEAYNIVSELLK